jgi:PTS system glucitol/sorbitol-specific IIA component
MPVHLQSEITEVGEEVHDLLDGGVLILFADGAPPELAEVSVLHRTLAKVGSAPEVGTSLAIGPVASTITAVGPGAWKKVIEIGHVVINFNGASQAERPGELCAAAVDLEALKQALTTGAAITIG